MYTKNQIIKQLENMNAPQDSVVLMHSSLRSVGDVEGGGEGLLDALIEYFTAEDGLFCVATHTWGNLGTDKITLDMTSPESNLGAFATIAAKDKRGIRSENPPHSMAVFGDRAKAEAFVRDDASVTTPTAPESCYGKLFDMNGRVLLVGVGQNKNTYLHCVDEILKTPDRMSEEPTRLTVKRLDGEVIERDITFYDESRYGDVSLRFTKYELPFRYLRCIVDGFLGDAPAQLCDARGMKEAMELIYSRCGDRDPMSDEKPIPPAWYCKR